jgi:hypothetical protein
MPHLIVSDAKVDEADKFAGQPSGTERLLPPQRSGAIMNRW